jgi:hypothetical protein
VVLPWQDLTIAAHGMAEAAVTAINARTPHRSSLL